MSKFKEGMRVVVIDDKHELQRGEIKTIYDALDTAIVRFDNGNMEKVPIDCLGIEPAKESEPVEAEPKESVEKSEITITPEEFHKKIVDLAIKKAKSAKMRSALALTIIGAEVHKMLFFDEGEND